MAIIEEASTSDPGLLELLRSHPKVKNPEPSTEWLKFKIGDWNRYIFKSFGIPQGNLLECIDNNPLLCADRLIIPEESTLLEAVACSPLQLASLNFDIANNVTETQPYKATLRIHDTVTHEELISTYQSCYSTSAFIRLNDEVQPRPYDFVKPILIDVALAARNKAEITVISSDTKTWLTNYSIYAMNIMCGYEDFLGLI